MPKAGQKAPDFKLLSDEGTEVSLKALKGTPVVLYFYPKDDTESCTKEACEFRELFPRFKKSGGVVLGISPDDVKSHAKFKKKYALPFTLLADTDTTVAQAYGVWGEKTLFGHKYMGVVRTTFVIDAKGKIARVFEVKKVAGHTADVEKALAELT